MTEGFRPKESSKTILQEHRLFLKDFDPSLKNIKQGEKLHIWQGTEDKTCGLANGQKIANEVPRCHMRIFRYEGHSAIFEHLDELGQILLE